MSTPVWVQLYYEREERVEMQDNLIDIGLAEIPSGSISGLARRLKENDMKHDLSHCDRGRIRVYPHGTTSPFLQDKAIDPGDDVPPGTTSKNPLMVVAPAKDGEGPTTQAQLRRLLQTSGVTPSEEVMNVLLKSFASAVTLVDTPEQARDLYFKAALLPRSATRVVLQQQGIAVADIFRGSDPSKAVLLHAHRNRTPHILKVATDKSILHEYEVWSSVKTAQQDDAYLVPLEKVEFESAVIEIGDISGSSSAHASVRCGVLMKHYQGTLSQCKIPLTSEVLLRYGRCLHRAISALHRAGYCHLDIKPSNIFLFEEACYLGDYGAAVKIGDPIRERTNKYYPSDGDFEAHEETDFYLLAVTLLEMFGAIPQASQRSGPYTKQEIRKVIATVETEEVQHFLLSLCAL